MSNAANKRPLTDLERHVLTHLLSVEFEGVAELRDQARAAQVADHWKPEGSPSFDIWLPLNASPSTFDGHQAPIEAQVVSADESYLGEIILWLADGELSALEYSWVTDDPPTALPDPAHINVSLKE